MMRNAFDKKISAVLVLAFIYAQLFPAVAMADTLLPTAGQNTQVSTMTSSQLQAAQAAAEAEADQRNQPLALASASYAVSYNLQAPILGPYSRIDLSVEGDKMTIVATTASNDTETFTIDTVLKTVNYEKVEQGYLARSLGTSWTTGSLMYAAILEAALQALESALNNAPINNLENAQIKTRMDQAHTAVDQALKATHVVVESKDGATTVYIQNVKVSKKGSILTMMRFSLAGLDGTETATIDLSIPGHGVVTQSLGFGNIGTGREDSDLYLFYSLFNQVMGVVRNMSQKTTSVDAGKASKEMLTFLETYANGITHAWGSSPNFNLKVDKDGWMTFIDKTKTSTPTSTPWSFAFNPRTNRLVNMYGKPVRYAVDHYLNPAEWNAAIARMIEQAESLKGASTSDVSKATLQIFIEILKPALIPVDVNGNHIFPGETFKLSNGITDVYIRTRSYVTGYGAGGYPATADDIVVLRNRVTGQEIGVVYLEDHRQSGAIIKSIAFTPDGKHIAVSTGFDLTIIRTADAARVIAYGDFFDIKSTSKATVVGNDAVLLTYTTKKIDGTTVTVTDTFLFGIVNGKVIATSPDGKIKAVLTKQYSEDFTLGRTVMKEFLTLVNTVDDTVKNTLINEVVSVQGASYLQKSDHITSAIFSPDGNHVGLLTQFPAFVYEGPDKFHTNNFVVVNVQSGLKVLDVAKSLGMTIVITKMPVELRDGAFSITYRQMTSDPNTYRTILGPEKTASFYFKSADFHAFTDGDGWVTLVDKTSTPWSYTYNANGRLVNMLAVPRYAVDPILNSKEWTQTITGMITQVLKLKDSQTSAASKAALQTVADNLTYALGVSYSNSTGRISYARRGDLVIATFIYNTGVDGPRYGERYSYNLKTGKLSKGSLTGTLTPVTIGSNPGGWLDGLNSILYVVEEGVKNNQPTAEAQKELARTAVIVKLDLGPQTNIVNGINKIKGLILVSNPAGYTGYTLNPETKVVSVSGIGGKSVYSFASSKAEYQAAVIRMIDLVNAAISNNPTPAQLEQLKQVTEVLRKALG